MLSFVFGGRYVYFTLSIAMLGITAAGTWVTRVRHRDVARLRTRAFAWAPALAMSFLVVFVLGAWAQDVANAKTADELSQGMNGDNALFWLDLVVAPGL